MIRRLAQSRLAVAVAAAALTLLRVQLYDAATRPKRAASLRPTEQRPDHGPAGGLRPEGRRLVRPPPTRPTPRAPSRCSATTPTHSGGCEPA